MEEGSDRQKKRGLTSNTKSPVGWGWELKIKCSEICTPPAVPFSMKCAKTADVPLYWSTVKYATPVFYFGLFLVRGVDHLRHSAVHHNRQWCI